MNTMPDMCGISWFSVCDTRAVAGIVSFLQQNMSVQCTYNLHLKCLIEKKPLKTQIVLILTKIAPCSKMSTNAAFLEMLCASRNTTR